MNVAIIGAGYWGQIYIKTLKNIPEANLIGVYTRNYKEILNNKDIDCVIIATPRETHYEITKNCLLAEKHVLVEKPFTCDSIDAIELYELSKIVKKVLLIGHVYLHHPGIIKIKNIIENKELGDLIEINSHRMNINKDPNSLWEMACHDIYIFDYLLNLDISDIKILGDISHCIINIKYKNINTYIEVNCNHPQKTREIVIIGSKKIVIFNDQNILITNKNGIVEKTISLEMNPLPLEKQCKHFFNCILGENKPISDAYNGYENICILERINKLL